MADQASPDGQVWIYGAGTWRRAADPIEWRDEDSDVEEKYAQVGYAEFRGGGAFIGLSQYGANEYASINLYVRNGQPPECLLSIEGTESAEIRTVYADTLPDGLDLLARWTPIVEAATLLSVLRRLSDRPER